MEPTSNTGDFEEQSLPLSAEVPPSRGLSTNALKLIAIIAMLIDHTATIFIPSGDTPLAVAMHFVGRITGPTMFFMVAQGYRFTRNKNRYMLRLLAFAAVSYVPFIYAFTGALPGPGSYFQLNVIYTIFIGLVGIRVRNEIANPVLKIFLLIVLMVLSFPGDWGVLGYLIMLGFDYFYGDFKNQAVAYCATIFMYGGIISLMVYPLYPVIYGIEVDLSMLVYSLSSIGMFIPIVLRYFYNGQKGRGGKLAKWGFYIFYPLHMVLLRLIEQFA